MRMIRIALYLLILLIPAFSHATKPCRYLSKSQFIAEVASQSDLVALVTIQEMSPDTNTRWTKVIINEKIFNKKNETGTDITINKWRADYEPLFNYKIGDKLVLWLRKVGGTYELTNDNWSYCEPAIWSVKDNLIQPVFNDESNSVNDIAAIKKLITEK